jgi:hypothetical protein
MCLPSCRPLPVFSRAGAVRDISASAAALHGPGKEKPVQNIWCVGRNYAEHIKELANDPGEAKYPMIFLKSGSTICPSGEPIMLPSWSQVRGREDEVQRHDMKEVLNSLLQAPARELHIFTVHYQPVSLPLRRTSTTRWSWQCSLGQTSSPAGRQLRWT